MISIKKFLTADNETERALMHAVNLLVQGIGETAVDSEAEDTARFRESVQEVCNALEGPISPADLLVQVGSVLRTLDHHNRRTARQLQLRTRELGSMVTMLTSTVTLVSTISHSNILRLAEIEKQIAIASELDDVRVIKAKLSDCLNDIRQEAERQRVETQSSVEELSRELDRARKRPAATEEAEGKDALTGLALRPEAELALAHAGRGGPQAYAVVVVLDRMQTLNARFGREVGDEILSAFVRTIQSNLSPGDRLFRWSGPALVALLVRASSMEHVRSEFGRFVDAGLEHTVRTPSRSILVPIASRWVVFPMMAAPRLLYQKIDTFVASPSSGNRAGEPPGRP